MPGRVMMISVLAILSGTVAGCGGGEANVEAPNTGKTMGQELRDLDEAYQAGRIDESQYSKAQRELLNRYK